ncbi:MAG TPA: hypothetical protein VN238_03715 [Solirubrobacteraceae bacterium]|nr:hypothetical protein [Solirubrobacteraceae bacterium]
MSGRDRRVAVAAALATAAAGAASALGGGITSATRPIDRSERPEAATPRQAPPPEVVPGMVDAPPVNATLARRAERTARTFIAAFLHYEVGRATDPDRRVLRVLSAPELAAALLDVPPRLPDGRPAQARVRSVELLGADDTSAEVAVRVARPRAAASTITVVLQMTGSRTVVTGLR